MIRKSNFNTLDCVDHAEQGGLFDVTPSDARYSLSPADYVHVEQLHLNSVDADDSISLTSTADSASTSTAIVDGNSVEVTTSLRALECLMPSTELQSDNRMLANTVDTDQLAHKWLLNPEQLQAFRIITEHSLHQHDNPLRMFISDAARHFRLSSYMGIAARHISGMTLHSLLCLSTKKSKKSNDKSHRDLMAMWEGIDYLFIDEVSMISCQFLCRISEALSFAKGDPRAFGGINIIFAGDFGQLPRQKIVFRKLLWLTVTTVIILRRSERQIGDDNKQFVELLARLCEGRCTAYNFDRGDMLP